MTQTIRPRHPAPYPNYMLDRLALYLGAERRVVGRPLRILDVFAGIGRIHDLPARLGTTIGVEIEPEWAAQRERTVLGDATALPDDWTETFDAVTTSPCYGNRMSDHHEAQDSCAECNGTGTRWTENGCGDAVMVCSDCHSVDCACGGFRRAQLNHNKTCATCRTRLCSSCKGDGLSKRYTYRHALGRPLDARNAGQMQWSAQYRDLHEAAWREARRVLKPGGLMLVNCKNHIRGGVEQLVVEWHVVALRQAGFVDLRVDAVPAPGVRHGANRDARVDVEKIIVGRA